MTLATGVNNAHGSSPHPTSCSLMTATGTNQALNLACFSSPFNHCYGGSSDVKLLRGRGGSPGLVTHIEEIAGSKPHP